MTQKKCHVNTTVGITKTMNELKSSKDFGLGDFGDKNSLSSLTCALPVFDGVMLSIVHVACQVGSRVGTVEPPRPFE